MDMARLFKANETAQYLNEWMQEGERGKRFIRQAAREQRANLEAVKRNGHGGWCDVAEYEQCVRMIEKRASQL